MVSILINSGSIGRRKTRRMSSYSTSKLDPLEQVWQEKTSRHWEQRPSNLYHEPVVTRRHQTIVLSFKKTGL